MYGKKLYVVVTFETTSQAIHFEQSSTVKGRLIPLPSTISAGCGLAWRSDVTYKAELLDEIKEKQFIYKSIVEIMMR